MRLLRFPEFVAARRPGPSQPPLPFAPFLERLRRASPPPPPMLRDAVPPPPRFVAQMQQLGVPWELGWLNDSRYNGPRGVIEIGGGARTPSPEYRALRLGLSEPEALDAWRRGFTYHHEGTHAKRHLLGPPAEDLPVIDEPTIPIDQLPDFTTKPGRLPIRANMASRLLDSVNRTLEHDLRPSELDADAEALVQLFLDNARATRQPSLFSDPQDLRRLALNQVLSGRQTMSEYAGQFLPALLRRIQSIPSTFQERRALAPYEDYLRTTAPTRSFRARE